jgi:hypothetical protein
MYLVKQLVLKSASSPINHSFQRYKAGSTGLFFALKQALGPLLALFFATFQKYLTSSFPLYIGGTLIFLVLFASYMEKTIFDLLLKKPIFLSL